MTKLVPLVLQLQAEAVDPKVPVSKLLRLAKLIATKLDQKDALVWIDKELDGYMSGALKEVPPYRMLTGHPKGYNPTTAGRPSSSRNPRPRAPSQRSPLASQSHR